MAEESSAKTRKSRRAGSPTGGTSEGPATDRDNRPVVDPTENVLALVAAAIRRQDDLRNMSNAHLQEIATLRAEHAKELSHAEAARIDAIRLIDVGAVNRAAEVASIQATTLASQVATVAETLRAQVAAAATASTVALAAALEPIQKDVSELRQVQFQQQGERVAKADDRDTRVTDRTQTNWLIGVVVGVVLFAAAEFLRRGGI